MSSRLASVRAVPHRIRSPRAVALAATILLAAGCAATGPGGASTPSPDASPTATAGPSAVPASPSPAPRGTITMYSTVTQATVESVVAAYQAAYPDVTVDLFRAPTGEVTARIAAEQRTGGIKADLLWLTDPLSVQQYDQDQLLATYEPAAVSALDPADHGPSYWGTRLLNMVMVTGSDVSPAPTDWDDLADPAYRGAIAVPDPGFAGSAFALLGHFSQAPGYGIEFYQRLRDNGVVVVKSPDEVTTGVAEGRFKAGITLDFSVRAAAAKGSPVELVWPASGAVTLYSPIAQVSSSDNEAAARSFIDFVLSPEGQALIGESGWQPVRSDVAAGPPPEGPQVRPDWSALFGLQSDLLAGYRAIFGE